MKNANRSETPLFRHEAISATRPKLLGSVIITQPLTFTLLTIFFAGVGACLLVFIFTGEYTKRATITGQIIPDAGVLKVVSPAPGILVSKLVKEGSTVKTGDLLFVISGERSSALQGQSLQAVSSQIRSRQNSIRAELAATQVLQINEINALNIKAKSLEVSIRAIRDQLVGVRSMIKVASNGVQRYTALSREQFISMDQLQEKQIYLLEQQTKLRALVREHDEKELELETAKSEIASVPLKHENIKNQLKRNLLQSEQELIESEQKREIHIISPGDGRVTGLLSEVGAMVDGSIPIASIVPLNSTLRAELYAPSRSIGFVHPGDVVLLRIQAYPYQKFGQRAARIRSVSVAAFSISELSRLTGSLPGADLNNNQEQYYRISVNIEPGDLDPKRTLPLVAGMMVDADILRDRRTIFEWIFEPLFAFNQRGSRTASEFDQVDDLETERSP
ncbi:HlyD family secretion protein [Achromobacter sp. Root83]|uniref:HlyD family secretion protein n=1 Tax=Achromobacter sp. Root83 TaxID=1736602 RepID=UPI0009E81F51|nr:HlyD family efflux transporter periplasmic adaptor subunit [Achromobacter sp. Root83]